MPRMRMVKPEFWTDGKIVRVSRDARLLFIGTWNFADCDAGHLEEDCLSLKMKIFPADNLDVEPLLDELVRIGLLERFTFEGAPFLHIPGLRSHQRTDSRWTPRCRVCQANRMPVDSPELTEPHVSSGELTQTRESSHKLTEPHASRGGERKGEERWGEVSNAHSASERFDEFWSAYPRKVGKQKARSKFTAACRRATADDVIAGAHRLARDPNLPEAQFVPHPTTWLERDGWEDEPLPPRTQPKTFDQLRHQNNLDLWEQVKTEEEGPAWPPKALGA